MKSAVFAFCLCLAASVVPKENLEKGSPPNVSSAKKGAAALLDAIATRSPEKATSFFFPEEAFDLVKDIPKPERYHRRLLTWYEEDIRKEHPRFKTGEWRVTDVALGRCKWKDIGTEQNKIAYWSCIGNFVTAVSGDKKRRFEIRVLINWGDTWYVTHLGPIR